MTFVTAPSNSARSIGPRPEASCSAINSCNRPLLTASDKDVILDLPNLIFMVALIISYVLVESEGAACAAPDGYSSNKRRRPGGCEPPRRRGYESILVTSLPATDTADCACGVAGMLPALKAGIRCGHGWTRTNILPITNRVLCARGSFQFSYVPKLLSSPSASVEGVFI
jgi:hypothetical protein